MEDPLKIPLSRGLTALVSERDAELVLAHKWRLAGRGVNTYALTKIDGKTVYMHRLILSPPKGQYVDHWNNDGLDNRRENIRICSPRENAGACRPHRVSSTSGIRGIHKHGHKWRVIAGRENGKTRYVGSFETLTEAVTARKAAAVERWGEFARNG